MKNQVEQRQINLDTPPYINHLTVSPKASDMSPEVFWERQPFSRVHAHAVLFQASAT